MSEPTSPFGAYPIGAAEQAPARSVLDLLRQVPGMIDRHEANYLLTTREGSDMATDDALTAPFQLSNLSTYCLSMSVDGLRALNRLMRDGDELLVPQTAHYSLIRTVLEASAQAVWLLAPDVSRERVLRLLASRASELTHEKGLVDAMASSDPVDEKPQRSEKARYLKNFSDVQKKRSKILREIGHRSEIDPHDFQKGSLRYREIVASAAESVGATPSVMRAAWHTISGLTHPSSTRAISTSVIDEIGPRQGDLVSVRMSSDLRFVDWALTSAVRLYLEAERLSLRRRGLPGGGDGD